MKKPHHILISTVIIVIALFPSLSYSEAPSGSAPDLSKPQYTFIKDCEDITHHDNAAFTELSCEPIGKYQVNISERSPRHFNIHLIKSNYKISTDFTIISNDNPMKLVRQ